MTSAVPGPSTDTQLESPLIPGTNARLIDNAWWVSQVIDHNQSIEFDAISPVRVQFDVRGGLSVSEARCNASGYQIIAADEQRYQLFSGATTAVGCNERATAQARQLREALLTTTAYEQQTDQLLLTGEDVQIVLQDLLPENPWTIGAGTDLLENRWRLNEVTAQGKVVNFGALQPIYLVFGTDGYLRIVSSDCYVGSYEVTPESARQYAFTIDYISDDCGSALDTQTRHILEILDLTTEFAMHAEQLFLIGDDVRLVLTVYNATE